LGTPTENAASGTVDEIETHILERKPAMLYFSDAMINPSRINLAQREKVDNFKAACCGRGLVESFNSTDDFRAKFARHLAQTVSERFEGLGAGAPPASGEEASPILISLSDKAKQALVKASESREGHILFINASGAICVQVGLEVLLDINRQTAREAAEWKAALRQLIECGLVEGHLSSSCTMSLTEEGFQAAEQIKLDEQATAKP